MEDDSDDESTQHEVQLGLNEAWMKERYAYLFQKRLENTRFIDPTVLDLLGIREAFYSLMDKGGITRQFWEIREEAYNRLTLEFLCSVQVTLDTPTGVHYISFRLKEKNFTLSEEKIAQIFFFKRGGDTTAIYDKDTWSLISDRPVSNKTVKKANLIQHPLFRFIQRALSLTVFARGEQGVKVSDFEMAILEQIISEGETEHLNIAVFMMKFWEKMGRNKRLGHGQYTMGGLITHLAKKNKITNFRIKKSKGPNRVDVKMLWDMRFVEKVGEEYFWKFEHHLLQLPYNRNVVIGDPATYLVVPAEQPHAAEEDLEALAAADEAAAAMRNPPNPWESEPWPESQSHGPGPSSAQGSTYDFGEMTSLLRSMEAKQEMEYAENKAFREESRAFMHRVDPMLTWWERTYGQPPADPEA